MKKSCYSFTDKLTTNQKASLKAFLKAFVKKNYSFSSDIIFEKFKEEMSYHIQIENSSYLWIEEFIDNVDFCKEIKHFINQKRHYELYKKSQEPYIQKQKEFAKIIKQKQKRYKQSKMKPTKKQISYYNFLCEKYDIKKIDLQNKSRLDLIEMIDNILIKQGKND